MNIYTILLTALFPIVILSFYIWRRDKNQPEPTKLLLKAFFFGVISIFVSLCISIPFGLLGLYQDEPNSVIGAISCAFFGAAIPEETAKLLMLWLVLRNNKYFDEKMDGIVYAVFVSLGFAAFENITYLFDNIEDFLSVGISRSIFAVPGHFCYGILMGYYYSLVKFYPSATLRTKVMVLLAPIIAHGVYDFLLMAMPVIHPIFNVPLFLLFIVFCWKMWKFSSLRIKEHLQRDGILNN